MYNAPDAPNGRYVVGMWTPSSYVEILSSHYPDVFKNENLQNNEVYVLKGALVTAVQKYVGMSSRGIVDIVLWRNGIYIILLFINSLFIIKNNKKHILVLELLPLSILCTLILVIGWQIYQYIWFFPISTIAILAYSFLPEKNKINETQLN